MMRRRAAGGACGSADARRRVPPGRRARDRSCSRRGRGAFRVPRARARAPPRRSGRPSGRPSSSCRRRTRHPSAGAGPSGIPWTRPNLLELRASDQRFVPLVRAFPESFHPHLANVLPWPSEWKAMLKEPDWHRWPALARGASDAIVDALADAIGDSVHESSELELLLAVDTPRALARLANLSLARADNRITCRERACLEIPEQGPAIRRFDPGSPRALRRSRSAGRLAPRRREGDGCCASGAVPTPRRLSRT